MREEALALGARVVIDKPFQVKAVISIVESPPPGALPAPCLIATSSLSTMNVSSDGRSLNGSEPTASSSPKPILCEAAMEQLAKSPDGVILDFRLPDGDGLSILKRIRQQDPDLPVVMLTAHKDAETIVAAMKAGASDYVTKPFEVSDVAMRLSRAHGRQPIQPRIPAHQGGSRQAVRLRVDDRRVRADGARQSAGAQGGGESRVNGAHHRGERHRQGSPGQGHSLQQPPRRPAVHEHHLLGDARNAARVRALRSRARARSPTRASRSGGSSNIADEGTVFLDEIGEMSPTLQAKLLRVLEDRAFRRLGASADIKVDVRVIAATNRNLEDHVREGKFRDDLYYRLNVLRIEMPPLRDRGRDVVLLADYYLQTFSRDFRRPASGR